MLGGTAEPEMQKYGYDYPFERRNFQAGASSSAIWKVR
jgi:hypothetical protein